MIWHPLLLAVLTMDLLALFFVSVAALFAMQIMNGWAPESPSEAQITLERRAEAVSIQGRTCLALLFLSTLVLIIGITGVLPKLVPGAMCGTGVLQATKGAGGRALALRALALALLACWHLLDRLNRGQPQSPLATVTARALLLGVPMAFVAVHDTFRAILRLDVHRPVECCSVVYDQVRSMALAKDTPGIPDTYWIWGMALGGAAVILLGIRLWRFSGRVEGTGTGLLTLVTILWVPVAATALVRSLAAYHYGVLQHRCPWCLFLPEHRLVGYPLLAALVVAAVEASAALICMKVADKFPVLESEAQKRSRTAGLRVTTSTIAFLALAGLPPIVWWLRFGVWMG